MRVKLSAIKADVGSIGGHTRPSKEMLRKANSILDDMQHLGQIIDYHLSYTGDDIYLLMSSNPARTNGETPHDIAWQIFQEATEIAKEQGLYGAGQDILSDAYSGNVKGLGPGVAELEFEERPGESFILLMADKTEPSAFNRLLYLAFGDPFHSHGMLLSKAIFKGFRIGVMDLQSDTVGSFNLPEENRELLTLFAYNTHRFAISGIWSREHPDQQTVAASTTRLHNIAGRYVGKDDPVAIVRTQKIFPATEEILPSVALPYLVGGDARGSHYMPLMPVTRNYTASSLHCIPTVSALAFSMRNGRFTEPVDLFEGKEWDPVRVKAEELGHWMWQHGPFAPFMLPPEELEYGDVDESVEAILEERFEIRE